MYSDGIAFLGRSAITFFESKDFDTAFQYFKIFLIYRYGRRWWRGDFKELEFKYHAGVRRNQTLKTFFTKSKFWRHDELGYLAHTHQHNRLIPTRYNFFAANGELYGLGTVRVGEHRVVFFCPTDKVN